MPKKFVPLTIPPGVVRPGTAYKAKGGWYDTHLVRWHEGALRPVGGWELITTGAGPSAAPNTPGAATDSKTQVTGSWVNGDSSAETEVWVIDVTGGGAYALFGTAAAAATSLPVTGLSAYHHYKLKYRHKKNGKFSAFTSEVDGYTQLEEPNFYAFGSNSTNRVTCRVKQNNDHSVEGATDIEIDRAGVSLQDDDFASGNSATTQGSNVEVSLSQVAADGKYTIKMFVSTTINANATDFNTLKLTVDIEYYDGSSWHAVTSIVNTFQVSHLSGPPPYSARTLTWDPYPITVTVTDPAITKFRLVAASVQLIGTGAAGSFILRGGDGAGSNPETYRGVEYSYTSGAYSLLTTKTTINLGVMSPDHQDTTAGLGSDFSYRARAKKTGWGGGDYSAYTVDEDGDNANRSGGSEPDAGLF